ncbi:MAG TPA: MerR family DNA-binding transcriptional regulator [Stellaceae bacterium]|nr:MerR family DNA-binding transcriptional regulator [Stellaceae bacterium]
MIGALETRGSNGDGRARLYSIGDLAAEFEVSQRAIRFYEDQGLLKPQRIGANRVYTHGDRARLALILRGKRLGFSLADIKEMLDLYDVDPDHLEQLRVTLDKGRARIAELERQRAEIDATLVELREIETAVVGMIRERERGSRKRKEGGQS